MNTAPANNRPIKILLMDARTISSIRNIYSDEMLFLASIHHKVNGTKYPKVLEKYYTVEMSGFKKGIDFGGIRERLP